MNDEHIKELDQVKQFVAGTEPVSFKPANREETYRWLAKTLKQFDFVELDKIVKEKTDLESAQQTQTAQKRLFAKIFLHQDQE